MIRLPLGGIAETLTVRPEPEVAQISIQPRADWSARRRDRMSNTDSVGYEATSGQHRRLGIHPS